MKNICVVTHHPFWNEPLGCGSLIRARCELLSKISDQLFVLFITNSDIKCPLSGGATLKLEKGLSLEAILTVKNFLKQNSIQTVYFSYDQFGEIADRISCRKIVEIHDVLHLRQKKFEEFGFDAPYKIEKKAELESLGRYDVVACLNIDEVDYLNQNLVSNAIYLPPNMHFNNTLKKKSGISAGMIASLAKPNIDGLHNSLRYLKNYPQLVFAGPICSDQEIQKIHSDKVASLGIVQDVRDFYMEIDVALSPIRFGGGLKIKVFEALANGKSVIATQHSAEGFPSGIKEIINIEDDFSKWDMSLLEKTYKIKTSDIEEYFQANFSYEKCEHILRSMI